MAGYRQLRRAIVAATTGSGAQLSPSDPDLLAFQRRINIAGPEHNWGLSIGDYLPGARSPKGNWSNADFERVRNRSDYALIESGWAEKRSFLTPLPPIGTPSAGWTAFTDALPAQMAQIEPSVPDLSGFTVVSDPSAAQSCGNFNIAFDPSDGSVWRLTDTLSGHDWALPGFLKFTYATHDEEAFNVFNMEYNPGCGPPCGDFAKGGMSSASPESREWSTSLRALYLRRGAANNSCTFVAQLSLEPETTVKYGGMEAVFVTVDVSNSSSGSSSLAVTLAWFNKTATRLAESAWLSFTPNVHRTAPATAAAAGDGKMRNPAAAAAAAAGDGAGALAGRWWLDVLGHRVYPDDVVENGTRHTHAVWDGFGFKGEPAAGGVSSFVVHTLDAFLVGVGDRSHLLRYDGKSQPDFEGGIHVNVENNLWGTAFPQWAGDDAQFRFVVEMDV